MQEIFYKGVSVSEEIFLPNTDREENLIERT